MIVDKIYVRWSGESIELDSCPFGTINNVCRLNYTTCKYGLTEIRIPKGCPLDDEDFGEISIRVRMYVPNPEPEIRRPHEKYIAREIAKDAETLEGETG